MTAPTLSVLSPNYNHAAFLPVALDAVLAQSYRPVEIIIIDDASTDDSVAVIERYRQRAPDLIRAVHNETNRGVLANMQQLMSMATGDYVYFAAADDLVLPGLFERSMRLLARYPQAGLCTSLNRVIDVAGRDLDYVSIGPFASAPEGYLDPADCRRHLRRRDFCITGNTTVYHRWRIIEAGGFRPALGPFCDGFLSQALALRHGACYIPEGLAAARWTGNNYSLTLSDSRSALPVHEAALALMRGEFADEFPTDFVAVWRGRSYYNMAAMSLREMDRRLTVSLRHVAEHAGGLPGVAIRLASAAVSLACRGATLAVGAVLRWRDLPRIHTAFSPRAMNNRAQLRKLGV
jgi:hypothetical protein